jgi:hypothetical protein
MVEIDMPATPQKIWAAIHKASGKREFPRPQTTQR